MTKIIFFGSTNDSVIVLEKLVTLSTVNWSLCCIVTQPPRPVGRKQMVTPTPVEILAKEHNVAVLSFASDETKPWLYKDEEQVIDTLEPFKADLLISASYGQKIPTKPLTDAKFGGINVHPSILPRWRGGDPVPWAILSGDALIGVTVVTLSDAFDAGLILVQKKIPIKPTDTSGPLRTHLFTIGAGLLTDLLSEFIEGKMKGKPQLSADEPRAKRLTRDLGFEPWEVITKAMAEEGTDAERIERKFRALDPWPGIWSTINRKQLTVNDSTDSRRLKILKLHLNNGTLALDEVQLEGKKPVSWEQFVKVYMPS